MQSGRVGCKAGAAARRQHEPVIQWRREYRAGKFGVADPPDATMVSAAVPVAERDRASAVTLLPVRTPTTEDSAVVAVACIEVVFACATVRICGVPQMAPLRMVLDCLARRA